jgi:hypothetical protein
MLLEALLLDEQPTDGWSKKQLEQRIRVSNGGVDDLLAGAVDLGLAEITDGRIRPASTAPDLIAALSQALRVAKTLPDRPVHGLTRRPYQRAG